MSEEENEVETDETIQEALMELLETKLAAFMGRADLSDSPPADKIAIRAAYFLGVNAGLSLGKAMDFVAQEDSTVVVPILPSSTDET